jgi:hypothetical protein
LAKAVNVLGPSAKPPHARVNGNHHTQPTIKIV